MNQATTGNPARWRRTSHRRDIVEGTMGADPLASVPHVWDEEFDRFRDGLLLTWAKEFDAWATTAPDSYLAVDLSRVVVSGPGAETVDRAIRRVFDLAYMCRDFMAGDLFGWMLFLRRHGVNDPTVLLNELRRRFSILQPIVRNRQWRAGLGVLDLRRVGSWSGEEAHETEAWRIAVTDFVPRFIDRVMSQIVQQPMSVRLPPHRPTENGRRVEEFLLKLRVRAHGETVTKGDIAALAGYQTKRELQGFQRQEDIGPTATRNIERALSMLPEEAVATLRLQGRLTA